MGRFGNRFFSDFCSVICNYNAMKYVRHITSVLIIILIAVLAAGTIVEKLHGSDFARIHVYSAW